MVEFYYWREGGGKSRLECVVLFLPDVWSAQPSRGDWTSVQERYKAACDATLRRLDGDEPQPEPERQGDATAQSGEHSAEKSQIVCSQFCLVLYPAARILTDGDGPAPVADTTVGPASAGNRHARLSTHHSQSSH